MPVSGLVLTMTDPTALAELAALPGVTLGPRQGMRVATVLESDDAGQERERMRALRQVLGDGLVEVVFADFSDVDAVESGAPYMRRRLEVLP